MADNSVPRLSSRLREAVSKKELTKVKELVGEILAIDANNLAAKRVALWRLIMYLLPTSCFNSSSDQSCHSLTSD